MDMKGTLPSEFTKLTNLTSLRLDYNNLSGSLPQWVSEAPMLSHINLVGNQLTGTIPPKYFSKVQPLLGGNLLTGVIPTEVGKFEGTGLFLDYNLLTGSIPKQIYSASNLEALALCGNEVSNPFYLD